MLISFNDIHNILLSNNIDIVGAFHIGAHECEELVFYNELGLKNEDIIWIDAIEAKVNEAKNKNIPNVYNAVITDKNDEDIVFNVSNNVQSSSVLDFGTHSQEHPSVVYVNKIEQKSITVDTFFERHNIDASKYNFWNFDIQGAELMALKGAMKSLKYAKALYLEVNEKELYKGCGLITEIDNFLSQYNFKRVLTNMTQHGWGDALYIINMNELDNYINNYDNFQKNIVYNFPERLEGGIGDYIKFFMYVLKFCMQNNTKLYFKINNTYLEKYLRLKYTKMYITQDDINSTNYYINNIDNFNNFQKIMTTTPLNNNVYNFVRPTIFYSTITYDSIVLPCQDVFYFSNEVKLNIENILPINLTNYISIHLRLGDMYLETDKNYIQCYTDKREYNEEKLFNCIEENNDTNILFFCDNNNYKQKIKNKYNNIFITTCDIGHTAYLNTTEKQALDAVTEFYLITNSNKLFTASLSGFSIMASKFKNIPNIKLYE